MQDEVTQRSVEVTITPRHLVPDTNCFINHLHAVERILACKKFTVIVPLIGACRAPGMRCCNERISSD